MLDQDIKQQLTEVFSKLENKISLVYEPTSHGDLQDLVDLLNSLSETSSNIQVELRPASDGRQALMPKFHIEKNGKETGITFKGIPTGHEFSSLILAILNTDGKGKWPDDFLIQRIKKIKGPVHLKTYISLTCENCPDVVQALNQMALVHGNFKHEMIDGTYDHAEIDRLGIQGVPSVIDGDKLVSSGRISLLDLVVKLESHYGVSEGESSVVDADLGTFDVVVIGGGPAGASSAIYSVRKGLSTAMISEKFGGQVQDTRGIENLISVPYTEGPKLAAQLSDHVKHYPIKVFEHRKVKSIVKENYNLIHLESGEFIKAKSLIVATGAKWRELGVPGEKEYLGRGVAFCPHCDGPFYKDKKIAVVGGGNSGVEAAIDLAGIVSHVVVVEFNDKLKADQILVDKLKSLPNIEIVTNAKSEEIVGDGHKVKKLIYTDRVTNEKKQIDLEGIFIQIGLIPNSQFLKGVVELSKFGEVIVDEKCRTSVKSIYAAGDVTTTPFKQIIIAMGEGAKAALTAFEDRMYHSA